MEQTLKIDNIDIVVGLAWGDEAKGKITAQLAREDKYDFVCRWNGGHNAGHTVIVNGNKYNTNLIPSGVFYGVKSIIGPGCVVCPFNFRRELNYLAENGFDTSLIYVSPNAHIITESHIEQDTRDYVDSQGSTGKGIAPCYRDKYARTGLRVSEYSNYIVNSVGRRISAESIESSEFDDEDEECAKLLLKHIWDGKLYGNVLCEGAQGFWLDIDQGNYPYTTSSNTLPYSACSLGFPPQLIRKIIGACKIYDTRVGEDPDFPNELLDDEELSKLGEIGQEFGTTTGRRRKTNWLNMRKLVDAINVSGTTCLVVSKVDVISKLGVFKVIDLDGDITEFSDFSKLHSYIGKTLDEHCSLLQLIKYSKSAESI